MSTCAVLVARDEADVIGPVVLHTLWHVDAMIAADHHSVDGTRELLAALPLDALLDVKERGFDGTRIWTWLAQEALARGHEWALIVDADDVWHVAADPDLRIADFLATIPPETRAVSADSFNHIPTGADASDPNPLTRIGWRFRNADSLKVACRLHEDLRYAHHNAWYRGQLERPGYNRALSVRHFSIRTPWQLVTKVRNGLDSFRYADEMPDGYEGEWTQWEGLSDAEIAAAFRERFYAADPEQDDRLVFDPAPVKP